MVATSTKEEIVPCGESRPLPHPPKFIHGCQFTTRLGPYSIFEEFFLIPDALCDGRSPAKAKGNLLVFMGRLGF